MINFELFLTEHGTDDTKQAGSLESDVDIKEEQSHPLPAIDELKDQGQQPQAAKDTTEENPEQHLLDSDSAGDFIAQQSSPCKTSKGKNYCSICEDPHFQI